MKTILAIAILVVALAGCAGEYNFDYHARDGQTISVGRTAAGVSTVSFSDGKQTITASGKLGK